MIPLTETRPEHLKPNDCRKILRMISGRSLLNRKRSANIGSSCNVEDITECIIRRKQEWNDHISRMAGDRIVRLPREKSPNDKNRVGKFCSNLKTPVRVFE